MSRRSELTIWKGNSPLQSSLIMVDLILAVLDPPHAPIPKDQDRFLHYLCPEESIWPLHYPRVAHRLQSPMYLVISCFLLILPLPLKELAQRHHRPISRRR